MVRWNVAKDEKLIVLRSVYFTLCERSYISLRQQLMKLFHIMGVAKIFAAGWCTLFLPQKLI